MKPIGFDRPFLRRVLDIALPVTLQGLLQASFSVVDQFMTGQLGTASVAGIGLGGQFAGLYTVVAAAVATGAGVMIAQYEGSRDETGTARSFWLHLALCLAIGGFFTVAAGGFTRPIMGLYTRESDVLEKAVLYLRALAPGFLPLALTDMLSTLLRCRGKAKIPLYASLASAAANTALNWVLIFGHFGAPALGVQGAAIATSVARYVEMGALVLYTLALSRRGAMHLPLATGYPKTFLRQTAIILMPLLACEFLWSLGQNAFGILYGQMGAAPCAAMTLTNPIQTLTIGSLSGLSAAAGILIGKRLGEGDRLATQQESVRLLWLGGIGSLLFSAAIALIAPLYVQLFNVEDSVRSLTVTVLYAYALVAPFKVENMILEGGILRSGGKTAFVMLIDLCTWIFGVPAGFAAGLWLHLPIAVTYFCLSLEECIRFAISLAVFQRGKWMQNLTAA